jgi:pyruvyltransferase
MLHDVRRSNVVKLTRVPMTIYLKQFTDQPNAGDAASSVIVSRIANDSVQIIGETPYAKSNLIAIGSILHWADENSIVWGTGLIAASAKPAVPPKDIVAVRGHLTRGVLIRQGISCPAVFGDPGIFISDFFTSSRQTVSLGIIPHYVDADTEFVRRAREYGADIIDVRAPLAEYLRKLSSCRKIITSSLHGLVFAHAYGIPAVWVKLSPNVVGNGFKFFDYYSSIDVKSKDIPIFGPDDSLATIEQYCALPPTPIDKPALRRALLEALPGLKNPESSAAPLSGVRKQSAGEGAPRQGERFIYLRDSLRSRLAERVPRSSLFDPDEYLSLYEDLRNAAVDPHDHYVSFGVFEQRRGITERSGARLLDGIEIDYPSEAAKHIKEFDVAQLQSAKHINFVSRHNVAVYVHSTADYYRHSVATALAHALRSAGARCTLANEFEEAPDQSAIPIVVGPHEFFGADLPALFAQAAFLMNSVVLNAEPALSPKLIPSLPWLYSARGILDLGFHTSLIWRRGGIPSAHVLPPFDAALRHDLLADFDRSHPLVSWISPDLLDLVGAIESIADRPLDIFFAGNATRLRSEFLLRNAAYLAQKKCVLNYDGIPRSVRPLEHLTREQLVAFLGLSLLTKCALNLNRFSMDHFRWEKSILLGLSCGTPVVTTPCLQTPFFEPDVHYIEARAEPVDKLIGRLLDSPDGLARAQAATHRGQKVLEYQLTPERVGRHVLSFLADLPV